MRPSFWALKNSTCNYFNEGHSLNGDWKARGQDVSELVQFMAGEGLWFAPAVPGDEPAYLALHLQPAAEVRVGREGDAPRPEPEGVVPVGPEAELLVDEPPGVSPEGGSFEVRQSRLGPPAAEQLAAEVEPVARRGLLVRQAGDQVRNARPRRAEPAEQDEVVQPDLVQLQGVGPVHVKLNRRTGGAPVAPSGAGGCPCLGCA
jgi:hypothetical protein